MNVEVYYHILEIGIVFEKGKQEGCLWKIGERKRLKKECCFWSDIIKCVKLELNGDDSSDFMFEEMIKIANEYNLMNYSRIINMRDELKNTDNTVKYTKKDLNYVNSILEDLLHDLNIEIDKWNGKNNAYRVLAVMHNIPRAFHGRDILGGGDSISIEEAIEYSSWSMTAAMKEKYDWV